MLLLDYFGIVGQPRNSDNGFFNDSAGFLLGEVCQKLFARLTQDRCESHGPSEHTVNLTDHPLGFRKKSVILQ